MKKHFALIVCLVSAFVLPCILLGQSTFTGLGDGSSWDDPANWDMGVPFLVNANIGDGFTVNLDSNQVVAEIDMVGDGSSGTATLNHTAGTIDSSGWTKIGVNSGNSGTYNMSGNATLNYGVFFIGAGNGFWRRHISVRPFRRCGA